MTIERIFNDVIKLNLDLFEDNRGIFFELYNKDFFSLHGIDNEFIQDNISFSKYKYTIRGMHTQKKPFQQAKFLFLISGSIEDFFIDIRPNSENFGKIGSVTLNKIGDNIFIPKGYLHGFCTLENNTTVGYKVDQPYDHESEIGVKWDDVDLKIPWPLNGNNPTLSEKDINLKSWKKFQNYLDLS